jgi:WD40 repeat protein
MENLHKKSGKYISILVLVLIIICLNSCTRIKENSAEEVAISSAKGDITAKKTNSPEKTATLIPKVIYTEDSIRRRDYPVISIDNVFDLVLQKTIHPFFPEVVHIASNGRIAAVGNLSGIRITDLDSGSVLMQVDGALPDCNFGMDRYFQLNYDGSFLAITTNKAVQVWQVGGGIVYEVPYINNHILDTSICGADIPQIALSPDGMFLAESGMRFSAAGVDSYFRVVDIKKNSTVYEWNGKNESLNGHFYTFPNLGFSSDGKILQTFDPSRFDINGDGFHTAFRFWSTENWREIAPYSKVVKDAFNKGDLQFGVTKNNSISIISKENGVELGIIEVEGCGWENPCPMKFSPDGSKLAVLLRDESVVYKRKSISTHLEVYDISNGLMIDRNSAVMRNLDGVVIGDDGEIIDYEIALLKEESAWWTHPNYFAGFQIINENTIAFSPQVVDYRNQQILPYSGSCQIHMNDFAIECDNTLSFRDNITVTVNKKESGVEVINTSLGKDTLLTEIKYPISEPGNSWQFRLLDYVQETGTGFFCLDRNLREETCLIMDFTNNEILQEQIDLEGLIFSQKNGTAAFINKEEKALYLFNDETGTLKKMRTYRAVSLPIKPAFLFGGSELIYFVQSLDGAKNSYIERIDTSLGKVIKRYDIDGLRTKKISSISANQKEELWAVSDTSGYVYLIDPEEESVVYIFRAADEEIIDLVFSPDGKALFMMGESGKILIWAVRE